MVLYLSRRTLAERQWSSWLRALWLCSTCCDSYRNRSLTSCLCWWFLSSHWDQLTPDCIPWFCDFFFTFLYVFEVSELLRVPKPATWPVSQLTFPHENCRMSNLAVGLFALCVPGCHLRRSKHSCVVFLCFSSFSDLFHLSCPSKILSVNQKMRESLFQQIPMFLLNFFPSKYLRNSSGVFFLSHWNKTV